MSVLIRIVLLLGSLTATGVGWFWLVAGWSFVDAVYMTTITLSTVGFREVQPVTSADKVFISIFLASGLGVFMYGIAQLGESVVRSELGMWWKEKKMSDAIVAIKDHFIVCGVGRMGKLLCEDLADRKIPFVVIDSKEAVIEFCRNNGWPVMQADATDDKALEQAGLLRARGLAATLSSDADNLYLVVSARLVSQSVRIVARAFEDGSERKLKRAGADCVVSPFESGATKMGQLLTNPKLNDFVEIISDRNIAFDLAGVPIASDSNLANKKLLETDLRQRGVIVIAIRRQNGDFVLAPEGTTVIEVGDELFALGNSEVLAKL